MWGMRSSRCLRNPRTTAGGAAKAGAAKAGARKEVVPPSFRLLFLPVSRSPLPLLLLHRVEDTEDRVRVDEERGGELHLEVRGEREDARHRAHRNVLAVSALALGQVDEAHLGADARDDSSAATARGDDDARAAPGSDDYVGGRRRADGAGRAVARKGRRRHPGARPRALRLLLLVDGAGQPPPPGRNNARLCYMTLL